MIRLIVFLAGLAISLSLTWAIFAAFGCQASMRQFIIQTVVFVLGYFTTSIISWARRAIR